MIRNHHHN
ncbi:Protein of unknown function [Lactobacillus helveticus CIRM-BIA 953]|uniref:Uncharacterized protein n=1 Tax=Lactobacillus helveticus CIRM-BIA 953 TaxID=1226335 RepID=U4QNZ0_LACHE|nr:Protein of unknown function [Lactobacillus helveticus CIRM-BIA 953]